MSGTLISFYDNAGFALKQHTEAMTRLQEQAATGSRIHRASDAPSDAYQLLGLKTQQSSLENYFNYLSQAIPMLELSTGIIQEISNGLLDVKKSLTQVSSGTYTQDQRDMRADQVDSVLEQALALANSRFVDQFLFGGSNTTSAPYVAEYADGKITSVNYQGSLDSRQTEVAPGVRSTPFSVGEEVFRSDNRGTPVFLGDTGAAAGTGTSSVQGYVWLTVRDKGGYEVSIDDGATWTAAGGANVAVEDTRTGKVLFVDTTGISSEGVELVSVPGTHDVFNMLITTRDVLRNERGLTDDQLKEALGNAPEALSEVENCLVRASVSLGSRAGFFEDLKNTLLNLKYNVEDHTAALEDADIAQVAIDLSRHELLYQMSLSVIGRIMSMSLLDFIR